MVAPTRKTPAGGIGQLTNLRAVGSLPLPYKKPPPGGGGFSYFRRFSKVAVFRAVKYTRLNPYSAVTT